MREVITSIAVLALGVVLLVLTVAEAQSDRTSVLPPCATEDSADCYWDARTMGNGHGQSFVNLDGHIYYLIGE